MPVDFKSRDIPMPPPPAAADAVSLRSESLMTDVNAIVAFSYRSREAGDRLWGRMAGSPQTEAAIDYVANSLRAAGVVMEKRAVPFTRVDRPAAWHARVVADPALGGGEAVELRSAFPAESLAAMADRAGGGIQSAAPVRSSKPSIAAVIAPVVYVGEGSRAAIASAAVKGKIAIYTIEAAPAAFYSAPRDAVRVLLAAGAVGVVSIYNLPGNLQTISGLCPAETPCFTVGGEDGAFLRALIERAAQADVLDKVKLDLSITRDSPTALTAQVLVGKIPGRRAGGENLVISAHSDSFFAGANDNATGVAVMIGLAKHYAQHRPQHDLYVFLSAGHHEGTGGMRPLADAFPELPKANIVSLNLEHVGQAGVYRSYMARITNKYGDAIPAWTPTNWDSPGREVTLTPNSPAMKAAWIAAAQKFLYTGPARFGGPAIAEPAGLTALGAAAIQDVETSPWFHTSGDVPEAISPETMQRVALFYKEFLDRMDALTRADVWRDVPAAP
jgi:hypothetical protein